MNIKNWKTTLGGIVAIVAFILPKFGIELPPNIQDSMIAVGLGIATFYAKDGNVTGGSVKQ